MKLIHDEHAYRHVLEKFLGCRSSADDFVSRFSHLWRCDCAPIARDADATQAVQAGPGFYGLMDSINSLCEEYASSLEDGCGYRVSAEQFRKEIEALVGERSHFSRNRTN